MAIPGKAVANVIVPIDWNTQFSFVVIMLAAMQGTLGLESSDPCRISFRKYRVLLVLEVLEVVFAFVSEVLSFISLNNALQTRFQWIAWLAPSLLALGILELVLEVWHTLSMVARSRIFWQPLSAVGRNKKEQVKTQLLEIVPPLILTCISTILIGWKQNWWLKAEDVETTIALKRARECSALSVGALAVCMIWGFLLVGVCTIGLVFVELVLYCLRPEYARDSLFAIFPKSFDAATRTSGHWVKPPHTQSDIDVYSMLYKLEYGQEYSKTNNKNYLQSEQLENMDDSTKETNIKLSPPHLRNAIVGVFRNRIYQDAGQSSKSDHVFILFAEHFTILPLQFCVLAGVIQMYDGLDNDSRAALSELVDAVVVLAIVEIAIAVKMVFWGYGHSDYVHNYDRAIGEERRTPTQTNGGLLNRFSTHVMRLRAAATLLITSQADSSDDSSSANQEP